MQTANTPCQYLHLRCWLPPPTDSQGSQHRNGAVKDVGGSGHFANLFQIPLEMPFIRQLLFLDKQGCRLVFVLAN